MRPGIYAEIQRDLNSIPRRNITRAEVLREYSDTLGTEIADRTISSIRNGRRFQRHLERVEQGLQRATSQKRATARKTKAPEKKRHYTFTSAEHAQHRPWHWRIAFFMTAAGYRTELQKVRRDGTARKRYALVDQHGQEIIYLSPDAIRRGCFRFLGHHIKPGHIVEVPYDFKPVYWIRLPL